MLYQYNLKNCFPEKPKFREVLLTDSVQLTPMLSGSEVYLIGNLFITAVFCQEGKRQLLLEHLL